jgi:hypothetical protein
MCYNCGCQRKDDEMGHNENITRETIAKAALVMEMNGEETLKNMMELLDQTTPEEIDEKITELKK